MSASAILSVLTGGAPTGASTFVASGSAAPEGEGEMAFSDILAQSMGTQDSDSEAGEEAAAAIAGGTAVVLTDAASALIPTLADTDISAAAPEIAAAPTPSLPAQPVIGQNKSLTGSARVQNLPLTQAQADDLIAAVPASAPASPAVVALASEAATTQNAAPTTTSTSKGFALPADMQPVETTEGADLLQQVEAARPNIQAAPAIDSGAKVPQATATAKAVDLALSHAIAPLAMDIAEDASEPDVADAQATETKANAQPAATAAPSPEMQRAAMSVPMPAPAPRASMLGASLGNSSADTALDTEAADVGLEHTDTSNAKLAAGDAGAPQSDKFGSNNATAQPSLAEQMATRVSAPSAEAGQPALDPAAAPESDGRTEAHAQTQANPSQTNLSQATVKTTADMAAQIVRKLGERATRFEMVLTPEYLGKVEISMEVNHDGNMTARLAFETPQVAAEMRARVEELRRQLNEAGFNVADNALDLTDRQSDPQGGFNNFMSDQRSSRRAFAGGRSVTEAADAVPVPVWTPVNLSPTGVDMKV